MSLMILPSSRVMIRLAFAMIRGSCVENTNVTFSFWLSFSIMSKRFSADLLSRFAVGSSARMNLGFDARARATAVVRRKVWKGGCLTDHQVPRLPAVLVPAYPVLLFSVLAVP